MKKTILFIVVLILSVGANAKVLWTGSVATGNWSNNVTVDKSVFTSTSAGDILKVSFSAFETKDESDADITYWGFAFKKQDNSWNTLTGFVDGNLTQGSANACFILSAANVTELETYGLAVQGYYITISKVELLTVESTETKTIYDNATGVSTGDFENIINKAYDNKGNLSEAFMNDFIAVTYTATGDGEVRVANPNGWEAYTSSSKKSVSNGSSGVFVYSIPNATILEAIQQTGIIVYGKNITITKIELLKGSGRYDAVAATIGTDGIATFSSSKKLDFTGTGVTPYLASEIAKGKVTLTSVEKTYGYVGYMIKGEEGTYDIPVTADEVQYPTSYLKATGDYSGNVYRSVYSDYAGGGEDAINIKTKYRYIFAKKNSGDIGFYMLATDYSRTVETNTYYYHVLGAHKAYLETTEDYTPTDPSAPLMIIFGDDGNDGTTYIEQIGDNEINDNNYYDLSGRRVAQPTKGLYIVNGKKVFIK